MVDETKQSFVEVKNRLDEIVEAVSDDDIALEEALDLYEEAIKLGMKVSAVLEEDISAEQIGEEVANMQVVEGANGSEGKRTPESFASTSSHNTAAALTPENNEESVIEADIKQTPEEAEIKETPEEAEIYE